MMIKLYNMVLSSADQMGFIIEGMRNPMNSWDKSDSKVDYYDNYISMGEKDYNLMKKLANAGIDHRKFMRMLSVYIRIIAPLYWWKEFDTYKVGTVANSCSTMHKIQEKEFTLDDFSHDHIGKGLTTTVFDDCLENIIDILNEARLCYLDTKDKKWWWQMIQLLPSSYNQTRNVMLNYEVLSNIYHSRKNHKLDEWRDFCKWIEKLPLSDLITHNGEKVSEPYNTNVRR